MLILLIFPFQREFCYTFWKFSRILAKKSEKEAVGSNEWLGKLTNFSKMYTKQQLKMTFSKVFKNFWENFEFQNLIYIRVLVHLIVSLKYSRNWSKIKKLSGKIRRFGLKSNKDKTLQENFFYLKKKISNENGFFNWSLGIFPNVWFSTFKYNILNCFGR